MKFYSELTKKIYDSAEELDKAEKQVAAAEKAKQKKEAERKARAKEVQDAFKTAYELRDKFIADFGTYHQTLTKEDVSAKNIADLFELLFRF